MRPPERSGGRRKPTRKAERVERKGPALQTSRPGRAEMDADAKVPWKCARPAAAAPADEVVSAGADRTAHVLRKEGHDTVAAGGDTSGHYCFWATFRPFPHARRAPLLGPVAAKPNRRPGLYQGPRCSFGAKEAGPRVKPGATTASIRKRPRVTASHPAALHPPCSLPPFPLLPSPAADCRRRSSRNRLRNSRAAAVRRSAPDRFPPLPAR